jgi:hypothetical protein
MLVFVLLMLLVPLPLLLLVAPLPVLALSASFKPVVLHIVGITVRQPPAIDLVFAIIPTVVIAMLRVIVPVFAFFSFVPFVVPVVLRRRHGQRSQRRHQRSRQEYRRKTLISATHNLLQKATQSMTQYGCGLRSVRLEWNSKIGARIERLKATLLLTLAGQQFPAPC